MKVLIAHARYALPGGEEAVIDAQQVALETLGFDVARYEVDNAGLTKARAAAHSLWSRSAARDIGAVIDRERPDVLHVHNNFQQLSPSIYATARKRGVKVVQHLHNARLACINVFFERDGATCTDCVGKRVTWPGVAHTCYRESRVESIAATAVQLGHRAIGAHNPVDRFVAVSEALATALVGAGVVPAQHTVTCHNGIADAPVVRADPSYALFVGRIYDQKGLQVLLDAAASVPEFRVRIAGDGPQRHQYEAQAARRGLSHVTFLGRIGPDQLAREFAGALVVVAPSVGLDPLPTAVIEAARAGVATIGSHSGGIPEIVADTGVLVPSGDPVALAAALRAARADPSHYATLGAAARRRFEAEFTTAAFGQRLAAIYSSL